MKIPFTLNASNQMGIYVENLVLLSLSASKREIAFEIFTPSESAVRLAHLWARLWNEQQVDWPPTHNHNNRPTRDGTVTNDWHIGKSKWFFIVCPVEVDWTERIVCAMVSQLFVNTSFDKKCCDRNHRLLAHKSIRFHSLDAAKSRAIPMITIWIIQMRLVSIQLGFLRSRNLTAAAQCTPEHHDWQNRAFEHRWIFNYLIYLLQTNLALWNVFEKAPGKIYSLLQRMKYRISKKNNVGALKKSRR